jgi:hypothetical protein
MGNTTWLMKKVGNAIIKGFFPISWKSIFGLFYLS